MQMSSRIFMKLFSIAFILSVIYTCNLFARSTSVATKLNVECKNEELFLNQNIVVDGNVINLTENFTSLKIATNILLIKSNLSNECLNFGKLKKAESADCFGFPEKNLIIDFEINKAITVKTRAQNCQVRSIKINNRIDTLWFRKVVTSYSDAKNSVGPLSGRHPKYS